jgi:hypothetical protein
MKKITVLLFLGVSLMVFSDDIINLFPFRVEADISLFEIGKNISQYNYEITNHRLQVAAGQMLPFIEVLSENVIYRVAINNNVVKGIFVSKEIPNGINKENVFKTPEGIFIGMKYCEFKKILPNTKLMRNPQ